MERWEPPVAPDSPAIEKSRSPLSFFRGQDAVPETVEILVPRIAIAFMLLLPSSGRVPAAWLSVAGPLLVLLLLAGGTLQSSWGSPLSRASWLMDGLILGILSPVLVVNAFSATGSGPLRRAESSVYLQTIVAATIIVIGLILFGSRLRGRQALSWGVLFVPAPLSVIALVSAYSDFKTTSIVLALAIAWFAAAVITSVAQIVSGGFAVVFPAIGYVFYVFLAALITGCGFAFGGRPAPVSVVHPVFIIVIGIALLAPLIPSGEGFFGDTFPPRKGPRSRRSTRRSRQRHPQPRSRSTDESVDLDDLEDFRT